MREIYWEVLGHRVRSSDDSHTLYIYEQLRGNESWVMMGRNNNPDRLVRGIKVGHLGEAWYELP